MKIHNALILACLAASPALAGDDMQANVAEGKGIIKAFFGDLKGELVKGMKEHGPVDTISTCHKVAPNLAVAHSQMSGWEVGRTSLKVRNPENAPDAWETAVLNEFEARKAAGEDPKLISKAEIVQEDGRKYFRMMKAIPTAEVCTKCHGAELAEPVAAKLHELYPEDKATGFKVGDLRGAFTLKKPL
jgi:mono/diheme cytochrome c family protein